MAQRISSWEEDSRGQWERSYGPGVRGYISKRIYQKDWEGWLIVDTPSGMIRIDPEETSMRLGDTFPIIDNLVLSLAKMFGAISG